MSDALFVACPHCNALNRVPQPRLAEAPNCGKCHLSLFTGHPLALDAAASEIGLSFSVANEGNPLLRGG